MNGINFSMDGPVMNGTWFNPYTKDTFTVRDTFFENNQLMVQTTDGRMLDYNMIQSYVQCDSKDIPTKEVNHVNNDIPAEIANLIESPSPQDPYILEEDLELITGNPQPRKSVSLGSLNTPTPNPNAIKIEQGSGQTEDQRLIQRVLSRQQQPSISCNINWTKFPQKQMDVLMDMMGVDLDDVCDFYISKIDLNDIRESIKRDIKTYIEVAMGYIEPEVVNPKLSDDFYKTVVTPCEREESITEVSDTVLPLQGSMIVANEFSGLEFEEFPIERPEKSKKKTTKPTTKKTTKKK